MKRAVAIWGHLVFVGISVAAVSYTWYMFVYNGNGSFLEGTRHVHISGYFYPYRIFALTTALILPAVIANVLRLLQLCLPTNRILGQGRALRGISEYSILILLLSFLLLLPEIALINDKAKEVFGASPKHRKPPVVFDSAKRVVKKVLPWEKDYKTAGLKAKKEDRPLFIMMTADWCGWCRKLEEDTLSDKRVKELLKPFVCVQVFENKEVDRKYGANGYPNLAFANVNGDKVHGVGGYKASTPFIRGIIEAYEALEMKLPTAYAEASKHFFELDFEKAAALAEAGDVPALEKLLEPVNKDSFAERNYLIAQFEVPEGVNRNALDVFFGYSYAPIPESGVVLLTFKQGERDNSFSLVHRGCVPLHYQTDFSGKHLESKTFRLQQLKHTDDSETKETVVLQGTVSTTTGKPIEKAFVNVYDWQTIKTSRDGAFQIDDVAPGTFTINATARGAASKPTQISLENQLTRGHHFKMEPAETVHIRWAYQAEEGNPRFDCGDVINGEYIINIKDSRFSLRRGHPLGNWGSDIMFRKKDDGKLYFHLFDASGNGNGVLKSELMYHAIKAVDPNAHYAMRPDEAVEARQCYLVRCCQGDHYAKIQILDICLED